MDNLPWNRRRLECPRWKWRVLSLAHALLNAAGMRPETYPRGVDKKERADQTVLVIGGSGGMSSRYRDVVEKHGWSLRHYENRVPPGARRSTGKIALVVIMVSMVSHALREQVQGLTLESTPIVYLRSASVSSLRSAVEKWAK